ncbi:hypothetical protein [Paenibacillus elgii]|uniref:hypothetical protein n=1 Tax=Paenibacillus elgii TaxID=189691 RepID=UPI0004924BC3|nr:hypothetical protein [Paenibacillus elgii]
MNHSTRCILRGICRNADSNACSVLCGSYISLHGYSGSGGRIGAAGVPADYRLVTLKNSPARAEQPAAYALADAYTATFVRQHDPAGPRVKSLYLFSESPGTGKTTTAAALLNEWLTVHYVGSLQRDRQALERPAYFLDVNAWQNDYNTFNRPRVPDSIAEPAAARYYTAQGAAAAAPFAVLDDVGVRECTEGFRGDLHTVINERVAAGLPTVYTSNIPMGGLSRLYDARLADRVRDMCAEVAFMGGSQRGMR